MQYNLDKTRKKLKANKKEKRKKKNKRKNISVN